MPRNEKEVRPVSAELAKAIRKVDELLVAELGYDFAYCIMGNGKLIAASNSKNGVVPPKVAPKPVAAGT